MKTHSLHLLISFLLLFFSVALLAQDKTQSYYNQHVNEILPDARLAFQAGRYDRTVELCIWHYIIVGDNTADSLRDRAERCNSLSKAMSESYLAGRIDEAREIAEALLLINPDDPGAQELLKVLDQNNSNITTDSLSVSTLPVSDTLATRVSTHKEGQKEVPQDIESPSRETSERIVSEPVYASRYSDADRTRFIIKAGLTALSLKSFGESLAPGVSVGAYNLGRSIVGIEAGGYLCPNLISSGSLFGLDVSFALRAAAGIYPKIGAGFFSFKGKTDGDTATLGLCAGAGVTFLLGGSFCLELGAKYYPKLLAATTETVPTTVGASYEFPSMVQITSGGIAPFISLGWAF